MDQLRFSAKLYITTLVIAALGLAAFLLRQAGALDRDHLVLAVLFAALLAVAILFPIHWAHKTKLTLDLAVIFAATLLLEPGIAMLVAGAGVLLAQALRRQDWDQVSFNTSQSMLQAGLGGMVLWSSGWGYDGLAVTHPGSMLAMLTAAVVMYGTNALALSVVVGLQCDHSLLKVARELTLFEGVGVLSQVALGVLAALLVNVQIWALPLLLPVAFVVYRSIQMRVSECARSRDAYRRVTREPHRDRAGVQKGSPAS